MAESSFSIFPVISERVDSIWVMAFSLALIVVSSSVIFEFISSFFSFRESIVSCPTESTTPLSWVFIPSNIIDAEPSIHISSEYLSPNKEATNIFSSSLISVFPNFVIISLTLVIFSCAFRTGSSTLFICSSPFSASASADEYAEFVAFSVAISALK